MSKKRKTKKQKIAASVRHNYSEVFSLPKVEHTPEGIRIANISAGSVIEHTPEQKYQPASSKHSYTYVAHDVKNTINITTALIALNVIIYFILKLKVVNIPGIGF